MVNDAIKCQIIDFYKRGLTYRQIMNECGVTDRTIKNVLEKAGVQIRKKTKKMNNPPVELLGNSYLEDAKWWATKYITLQGKLSHKLNQQEREKYDQLFG